MAHRTKTVSTLPPRLYPVLPSEDSHRRTVTVIHDQLRSEIFSGAIRPGTVLSQVKLARRLGVSRTPLREAFRMLHEEGLIRLEANRSARVADFDPDELDFLYATRIMLESLGVVLTVPRLSNPEFDMLDRALATMSTAATARDLEAWEVAHRTFHDLLTSGSGDQLRMNISRYADLSQRYRRVYLGGEPRAWTIGAMEHEAILDAYQHRDVNVAAARLSRHLARTALSLIAHMTPERDPRAIRAALQLIRQEGESM